MSTYVLGVIMGLLIGLPVGLLVGSNAKERAHHRAMKGIRREMDEADRRSDRS